jgi:hypothetical protein
MAWLPPELEIGEEPELKPPEPEPEFVELDPLELEPAELDPEPELVPDEPELAPEEPELAEEPDEPDEAEPELLDALVLCVDPGRTRASAPAVTTLAMVTAVVVDRTLARPRSLAAWAWRIPLSRRVLMGPILRSRIRESLHEPSGSAMSRMVPPGRAGRGYPGNMKDT